MQDKDFDRFIRESLNNQQEPAYDPAHWDLMEDRLANFNTPQAQPASGSAGIAGGSMAKLGFVASAVLFTVLNTVAVLRPEIFENKNATSLTANNSQAVVAPLNTGNNVELRQAESTGPATITRGQEDADAARNIELAEKAASAKMEEQTLANNFSNAISENTVVKEKQNAAKNIRVQGPARNAENRSWNTAFGSVIGSGNVLSSGSTSQLSGGKPAANTSADCNGNVQPELTWLLTGSDTLRSKRLTLTTCQALNLKVIAKDKDGDKVTITSNIAEVLPGAQISQLENNTAQVEWKATSGMGRQQPYMVTFWLTDNRCAGVSPQSYQVAVSVTPAFIVNLNSAASIEKGSSTVLEVVGAPRGSSFRWFTPNGIQNNARTNRLEITPTQTALYRVQVISPAGCVATDSARISVVEPDQFTATAQERFIPNVITPNNDGSNDLFEIRLPENGPVKLEIFDRWGKQVYYKENYNNTWNAGDLPDGIYYYSVSAGKDHKIYKGWVEVVR